MRSRGVLKQMAETYDGLMMASLGVMFWSHRDVCINHSTKAWRVTIVVNSKSFCIEKDHGFQNETSIYYFMKSFLNTMYRKLNSIHE